MMYPLYQKTSWGQKQKDACLFLAKMFFEMTGHLDPKSSEKKIKKIISHFFSHHSRCVPRPDGDFFIRYHYLSITGDHSK